jgi:hypothetical protein
MATITKGELKVGATVATSENKRTQKAYAGVVEFIGQNKVGEPYIKIRRSLYNDYRTLNLNEYEWVAVL